MKVNCRKPNVYVLWNYKTPTITKLQKTVLKIILIFANEITTNNTTYRKKKIEDK